MLNDIQIEKLATDLIRGMDLPRYLAMFEWDRQGLQAAWAVRRKLVEDGFQDSVEQYADRVHRWGFGGQSLRASIRQHPTFSPGLQTLCSTWAAHAHPWDVPEAMESLTALLDIKYLGIARVSKFVCFLDQDRYAIYDSRVAYALKDLTLDGRKRVFPFVGGRPPKNTQYVLQDSVTANPRRIASVYVGFLRLLQRVAQKLNASGGIGAPVLEAAIGRQWTPALVEMALFMAGQHRLKLADIRPLDRALAA